MSIYNHLQALIYNHSGKVTKNSSHLEIKNGPNILNFLCIKGLQEQASSGLEWAASRE